MQRESQRLGQMLLSSQRRITRQRSQVLSRTAQNSRLMKLERMSQMLLSKVTGPWKQLNLLGYLELAPTCAKA